MPWNSGVYTRGYPSWSNDAANNLPISSTKFDLEDSDFATGLNNCLTKDGLNVPTGTLNWSQTAAIVMNLSRGSDGTIAAFSRTGGSNNPQLQVINADSTGISLNVSGGGLSLAVGGTSVVSVLSTLELQIQAQSGHLALDLLTAAYAFGNTTDNPTYTFQGSGVANFNSASLNVAPAAGGSGISVSAVAGSGASLTIAGNGSGLVNGLILQVAASGNASISLGGSNRATLNGTSFAWAFPAAVGADTMTITGVANNYAATLLGSSTSGQSQGLQVRAGTTTADKAMLVNNQANSLNLFYIQGDGQAFIQAPPAVTAGLTGCFQVGYLEAPQNNQNANYGLALSDRGKSIFRSGAGAVTWTIPANASVAFPVGTVIVLSNFSATAVTVAITSDTLFWSPSGTTGSRTLAQFAVATLYKANSTQWVISGSGIS
jgi:hypothetical protein